jgi:hypothetical protein
MNNDPKPPSTSADLPDRLPDVTRAYDMLAALLGVLGPGTHAITCTAPRSNGIRCAHVVVQVDEPGLVISKGSPWDLVNVIAMLAAVTNSPHAGAIVARSSRTAGAEETLRAWSLGGAWPKPCSAAEVRAAYATHPVTGARMLPEPGVRYQPGIPLPEEPHEAEREKEDGT